LGEEDTSSRSERSNARGENLKSFEEFLEKRFADSRRKAYYLMAIHENLTRIPKCDLQQVG